MLIFRRTIAGKKSSQRGEVGSRAFCLVLYLAVVVVAPLSTIYGLKAVGSLDAIYPPEHVLPMCE
jgi:hypothetical protein